MSRNLEPLSNSHFKFHFRQAAGQLPPSEKDPPLAPALLAGGTEPPASLIALLYPGTAMRSAGAVVHFAARICALPFLLSVSNAM